MSALGTIFVELDIDRTNYDKAQNAILDSATSTTLNVEKAWKALGSKSDVIFDAMRQGAQNAYDRIASSATSSTDAIIRAEQAKNDKINSINEQQFGKQTSFIDSLKSNWIAASAAIVAAWALVNKAVALMDQGAKAMQVESSFKIMAEAADTNAEKMIASMQKATRGTVEASDLMQKATKLMTLGYDPAQIERFSNVVVTASQIAGTSVTETYEKLSDAIATRMPRALVQVGAVTREQMQIVTAAIKAGASEWSLYELAMANLELKQKMLQGTQDASTLQMQKFHAQIKQTEEALGIGLLRAVQIVYGAFQALASSVFAVVAAYEYLAHGADAAKLALQAGADFAEQAKKNISGVADVQEKATKSEIDSARAKVDAQVAALKAIGDAKKNDGALTKSLMDQAKQAYEDEINMIQNAAKVRTLDGEDSLKVELDVIGLKKQALNDEYEAQALILKRSLEDFSVKQAKMKDLYLKYSKEYDQLDNQREQTAMAIRNKDLTEYASYLQTKLTIENMYIDQATAKRTADISAQEVALKDSRSHFLITEAEYINQSKVLTLTQSANEKKALDDKYEQYVIEKQKEMDLLRQGGGTAEQMNKVNNEIYQAYVKHEGDMQALTSTTNAKITALNNQMPKSFDAGWKEGFREFRDQANNAFASGKTLATTFTNSASKGLETFFDYTNKGFLNMRTLITGVAHDVYMALMKAFVINPVVSLLTTVIESLIGSLVTTAVTGIASAKAQAAGEIPAFTGIAAMEAASSVASVPYIGPVLAADAYSEMIGLGLDAMTLAAFHVGGVASGTGGEFPAMIVPGERILTNEQNSTFGRLDKFLGNGGASNGNATSSPIASNSQGGSVIHLHGKPSDKVSLDQVAKLVENVRRNGHMLKVKYA